MRLALPFPPSVNQMWRSPRTGKLAGKTLLSAEGRHYREKVAGLLHVAEPLTGRVAVSIIAHMPDRRRRDLDNLCKGIFDSLTHAGLWLDDEQIDFYSIARGEVVKGGMIVLEVHEIPQ